MKTRKRISLLLLICLGSIYSFTQTIQLKNTSFVTEIKGIIKNYPEQILYLKECYSDNLRLLDSTITNKKGEFVFSKTNRKGLYKIEMKKDLFFHIIFDGNPIEIRTVFRHSLFDNFATDSLEVVKSEENTLFYKFLHLQLKINIANYWLLQMMRLYPIHDSFHPNIENEYLNRFKEMEELIKKQILENPNTMALKIAKAYFQPVLPDWKEPDPDRNKIIAEHYFDYFNPSDSFYYKTNILPEKIEILFSLFKNQTESQQWHEEQYRQVADTFLQYTKDNSQNFEFVLNFILKKFDKEKYFDALSYIYDKWIYISKSKDCSPIDTTFNWIREKVSILRNIQIGSTAPDFEITGNNLNLYGLNADYCLLIFWATWCPHCVETVPKIKQYIEEIQAKKDITLKVISVSLDSDSLAYKKYVLQNDLSSWFNTTELKGWNGKVPKMYNIYATPTIFLLDKDKKIIAKPETKLQIESEINKGEK